MSRHHNSKGGHGPPGSSAKSGSTSQSSPPAVSFPWPPISVEGFRQIYIKFRSTSQSTRYADTSGGKATSDTVIFPIVYTSNGEVIACGPPTEWPANLAIRVHEDEQLESNDKSTIRCIASTVAVPVFARTRLVDEASAAYMLAREKARGTKPRADAGQTSLVTTMASSTATPAVSAHSLSPSVGPSNVDEPERSASQSDKQTSSCKSAEQTRGDSNAEDAAKQSPTEVIYRAQEDFIDSILTGACGVRGMRDKMEDDHFVLNFSVVLHEVFRQSPAHALGFPLETRRKGYLHLKAFDDLTDQDQERQKQTQLDNDLLEALLPRSLRPSLRAIRREYVGHGGASLPADHAFETQPDSPHSSASDRLLPYAPSPSIRGAVGSRISGTPRITSASTPRLTAVGTPRLTASALPAVGSLDATRGPNSLHVPSPRIPALGPSDTLTSSTTLSRLGPPIRAQTLGTPILLPSISGPSSNSKTNVTKSKRQVNSLLPKDDLDEPISDQESLDLTADTPMGPGAAHDVRSTSSAVNRPALAHSAGGSTTGGPESPSHTAKSTVSGKSGSSNYPRIISSPPLQPANLTQRFPAPAVGASTAKALAPSIGVAQPSRWKPTPGLRYRDFIYHMSVPAQKPTRSPSDSSGTVQHEVSLDSLMWETYLRRQLPRSGEAWADVMLGAGVQREEDVDGPRVSTKRQTRPGLGVISRQYLTPVSQPMPAQSSHSVRRDFTETSIGNNSNGPITRLDQFDNNSRSVSEVYDSHPHDEKASRPARNATLPGTLSANMGEQVLRAGHHTGHDTVSDASEPDSSMEDPRMATSLPDNDTSPAVSAGDASDAAFTSDGEDLMSPVSREPVVRYEVVHDGVRPTVQSHNEELEDDADLPVLPLSALPETLLEHARPIFDAARQYHDGRFGQNQSIHADHYLQTRSLDRASDLDSSRVNRDEQLDGFSLNDKDTKSAMLTRPAALTVQHTSPRSPVQTDQPSPFGFSFALSTSSRIFESNQTEGAVHERGGQESEASQGNASVMTPKAGAACLTDATVLAAVASANACRSPIIAALSDGTNRGTGTAHGGSEKSSLEPPSELSLQSQNEPESNPPVPGEAVVPLTEIPLPATQPLVGANLPSLYPNALARAENDPAFTQLLGASVMFGVFDGHGGRHAATFCMTHLPINFAMHLRHLPDNIPLALERAFLQTDFDWAVRQARLAPEARDESGACAAIGVCFGEKLYVAHAGDVRVVLSRNGQATPLTRDHTPRDAQEYARLRRLGVDVSDEFRVNGDLAVSRSFGDLSRESCRKLYNGVICRPEVIERNLEQMDEFLIVACDGIWDALKNDQAVRIVRDQLRRENDAQLAAEALVRYVEKSGRSSDNLSVVVIGFARHVVPGSTEKRVIPQGPTEADLASIARSEALHWGSSNIPLEKEHSIASAIGFEAKSGLSQEDVALKHQRLFGDYDVTTTTQLHRHFSEQHFMSQHASEQSIAPPPLTTSASLSSSAKQEPTPSAGKYIPPHRRRAQLPATTNATVAAKPAPASENESPATVDSPPATAGGESVAGQAKLVVSRTPSMAELSTPSVVSPDATPIPSPASSSNSTPSPIPEHPDKKQAEESDKGTSQAELEKRLK